MRLVCVLATAAVTLATGLSATAANPIAGPPPKHIRIWFTDTHGHRIQQTALGDVIRIHSSWGRVCVRRTNDNYCANPQRVPSVLERRVRPNLVIAGRVRAIVGVGSFTDPRIVAASIPVR